MSQLISIITVNYNGFALTCAMIDSVHQKVTSQFEIIVVDNGSKNDEALLLKEKYPDITVIRSEDNLGFAGGNNLGIKAAKGDYLMFMNNDTEVEDDSLHFLAQRLDSNLELGAVCPKIRFYAQPRLIQFAGYTPLSRITMRNSLIGFKEIDHGQYANMRITPFMHGAAVMVRKSVLDKAGLMPECYFLYYEELDWSERLHDAGYKIAYEPMATVFHKESATTGQASPLRTYYITRNRLLFASRNRKGLTKFLSLTYQLTIALPKAVAINAFHSRKDLVSASFKGAFDFIKHKTGKGW